MREEIIAKLGKRMNANYDDFKDDLFLRPVNMEHVYGTDAVYRQPAGDVAMVLYQYLGSSKENGFASSHVGRDELKTWKNAPDEETIMANALKNTEKMFPAAVVARNESDQDFMREDLTIEDITLYGVTMLSCNGTPNGACSIFYDDVRAKLRRLFAEDFYFVFANTVDVLTFNKDYPHVKQMLQLAGNANEYGDVLSGNLYKVDAENKITCVVDRSMRGCATSWNGEEQ